MLSEMRSAEQFGRRGLRWQRPADMPLSTSPLDAFINPIRASIKPRAYGLKNRERTNRMLMLPLAAFRRHERGRVERCVCRPVRVGRGAGRVDGETMTAREPGLGAALDLDGHKVLVGTCTRRSAVETGKDAADGAAPRRADDQGPASSDAAVSQSRAPRSR